MRQLKITKQITRRESPALERFLQEIGAIPLLKTDEEVALARSLVKHTAIIKEKKEKKKQFEARKRTLSRLHSFYKDTPIEIIKTQKAVMLERVDTLYQDLSTTPLLKPEEEASLAQNLKKYTQASYKNLDAVAQKDLVKHLKKSLQAIENEIKKILQAIKKSEIICEEIIEKLVEANLRFVVSVAKQYQNQGLSLSDLINIGIKGLIKAIKRFDPTRGFKLISYSVCWIRQGILQALAEEAKAVRLPLNRIGSLNKIHKKFVELEQQYERKPTIEEIGEELNMSPKEIRETLKVSSRHSSLNTPFVQGEEATLLDVLKDELEENPDKKLIDESLKKEISQILDELTPRERKIISYYFGVERDNAMTLEEIGEHLNLTRERVRQIKEKSLRSLHGKTLFSNNNLQFYLGN